MISTHTLRGERDQYTELKELIEKISTHTLRGERDLGSYPPSEFFKFQLTRSVGSVTRGSILLPINDKIISTHTLRGERDIGSAYDALTGGHFNSHAPWGA